MIGGETHYRVRTHVNFESFGLGTPVNCQGAWDNSPRVSSEGPRIVEARVVALIPPSPP
jgi:hypothetical protein